MNGAKVLSDFVGAMELSWNRGMPLLAANLGARSINKNNDEKQITT